MIADNAQPRIFFMHIPKAAGTSVNDFLEAVYGKAACAFHLESHPEVMSGLGHPAYDAVRVASGHIRLPHIKRVLSDGWQTITCLRNPVEHLLSHLRWVKYIGHPESEIIRARHSPEIRELALRLNEIALDNVDAVERFIFEEYSEARQLFDNCQTRYLVDRQEGRIELGHSNLALRTLSEVDFVFSIEQASVAMPAILRALGWQLEQMPEFPRSNRGPHQEDVDLTDARIKDFYRELVAFDARVFVEARRRGDALIAQVGAFQS